MLDPTALRSIEPPLLSCEVDIYRIGDTYYIQDTHSEYSAWVVESGVLSPCSVSVVTVGENLDTTPVLLCSNEVWSNIVLYGLD